MADASFECIESTVLKASEEKTNGTRLARLCVLHKVCVYLSARVEHLSRVLVSHICTHCGPHSDEGLTLETSVFESFTVANLPYRPCG